MATTESKTTNGTSQEESAHDLAVGDAVREAEGLNEVETLRAELAEARERELRALAEIENTRKRMRRDLDEQLKYAYMPLARDLLPVLDNLARAIESATKNPDGAGLLEGVRMVAAQLETVLGQHGVKRIEAVGKPFDPNLHKAIVQQPSADHPPQTVLLDAAPGFTLHDRVVRPSEVIVSTGVEP